MKIAKDKLVKESTDVTQGNWFELTIRPTGQLEKVLEMLLTPTLWWE